MIDHLPSTGHTVALIKKTKQPFLFPEHRPASRGMPYCGVDRLDPAPSDYPERDIHSPVKAGAGKPLPERLFQPAVLLSPPRQRDSQTQLPTKAGGRSSLPAQMFTVHWLLSVIMLNVFRTIKLP